ncbi:adhesion G-protein coupled receptor D1-like [Procambarus clarkii]|uniref:adhesion G-protein coupled receptor D1-like n=1 Tax=Procambarus clarkii TaxID=6728 RepID=UPI003742273B
MMRKVLFILILATAKGQMMDLFHRDLVALGAACSTGGFCNGSDYYNGDYQSAEKCNCDDLCAEYGDCCPDSVYYRREDQVLPERYKCVTVDNEDNERFYMKNVCMSGWEDEEVAQVCLAGSPADISSSGDPLAHLPATSSTTSVTYTNYYCALCNNDSRHLTLWKTQLEYYPGQPDNLSEYITSHLIFDNGSWGAFIPVNGSQIFQKCNINIKIPDIPVNIRKCDSTIKTCAENWSDASVAALCHSYTAVRYWGYVAYRNPHCLLCNWIHASLFRCSIEPLTTSSFALLTDFDFHSAGNYVGNVDLCQPGEFYNKFLKKCIILKRHNSEVDKDDKRYQGDKKVTTITPDSSACRPHSTRKAFRSNIVSSESNETLDCDKILLCEGEFTLNEKRMVTVEAYARSYQVGEYEVTEGGVLVCMPQELPEKFSSVLGWVSLAGLGLSCLCLLLHLAVFLLLPRLRNLPGKCLASLCLSLLTAYTIFILSTFLEPKTTGCYISAVIMYYSFLAAFCWMNIMAFDVWLTFRQAKDELRVSTGRQRSKFLFYSVYCWLLPALAVVVTVTLDKTAPVGLSPQFLPSFGQRWCWFGKRKALLVFFGAPLFTVMALNVVFFLVTSYTIGASREPTLRKSSSPQNKKQFVLYVRLAVLMGLTWITGIVAGYLQLQVVWYVFVVLNTLQGAFIFLTFTCRSKVWRDVQERCRSCLQQVVCHPDPDILLPGSGQEGFSVDSCPASGHTESDNL